MSRPAITAPFFCELQVGTPGPSSLKEAYLLKLALGAPFTTFGADAFMIQEPCLGLLPNRYRRQCNECSRMKSVFSQRPFGTMPKGQLKPISGLPAFQSLTFLHRSSHDIMPPYKTRRASELLGLDIQLLGWSDCKSCTQQFAGKGGLSLGLWLF